MSVQNNPWHLSELTYCCNVHPYQSPEDVNYILEKFVSAVRLKRKLSTMSSGIWLSNDICSNFQNQPTLFTRFRDQLDSNNITLTTLNGFPFGNFHQAVVKQKVYEPDWSDFKRYQFSYNLSTILAATLPDNVVEGTISTLPLGYKPNWTEQRQQLALKHLCLLAEKLAILYKETGRCIRICLEMEPGCVLESTKDVVMLFSTELPQVAKQYNVSLDIIHQHLGVCYDVCHQAVMFEDIQQSLERLIDADIQVGKIQFSSAIEIKNPGNPEALRSLREFIEPRYLHQVNVLANDGRIHYANDLPDALNSTTLYPRDGIWRIHYHVPIQSSQLLTPELSTTQDAINSVLDFLVRHSEFHPQLEVETYTWQVLPKSLRPNNDIELVESLNEELNWLAHQMRNRNLIQTEIHDVST